MSLRKKLARALDPWIGDTITNLQVAYTALEHSYDRQSDVLEEVHAERDALAQRVRDLQAEVTRLEMANAALALQSSQGQVSAPGTSAFGEYDALVQYHWGDSPIAQHASRTAVRALAFNPRATPQDLADAARGHVIDID